MSRSLSQVTLKKTAYLNVKKSCDYQTDTTGTHERPTHLRRIFGNDDAIIVGSSVFEERVLCLTL